jgi:glutamine synthetase
MNLPPISQDALDAALAPLQAHTIECAMSDFGSLARGKLVSLSDFQSAGGCKLPTVLLGMGVTGGAPAHLFGTLLPPGYSDMTLVPDLQTLAPRPGRPGEATVLCEPQGSWFSATHGRQIDASELSPRAALRRVIAAYKAQDLQALVAPELEMFLLQREGPADATRLGSARARPDAPGRESACEQYSLERTTQFEAYFDELYAACEQWRIPLAGHLHEAAFSQFEVNFHPADPLSQADAVFRFKRMAREIGVRHGFLASFAAKPFTDQPGTGMHWHFSVQRHDKDMAWPHLFATPDGSSTPALSHFIAGLQAHVPQAMAFLAPHDMSFDRIVMSDSSPTHADWGEEDRHAAFRIPTSDARGRRVENRLPGGDVNPYLAVALTMAFGLAGLQAGQAARTGRDKAMRLPRSLPDALDALAHSDAARQWLGAPLVELFVALQRHEHQERQSHPDPRQQWDLRHLIELA